MASVGLPWPRAHRAYDLILFNVLAHAERARDMPQNMLDASAILSDYKVRLHYVSVGAAVGRDLSANWGSHLSSSWGGKVQTKMLAAFRRGISWIEKIGDACGRLHRQQPVLAPSSWDHLSAI
jgi:hypothetical protein